MKYHLGQVGKFVSRAGNEIDVELAANPSHLEAVDPVVEGMARAKQDQINDPEAFSVLPILMHGDAAFAGQGVVAETLNLCDIKGYRVGRHDPHRHQQPARVHHPARGGPLGLLLAPTWPRWSRRRSST